MEEESSQQNQKKIEKYQKISFTIRRPGSLLAVYFTYYDQHENFMMRNLSATKDVYHQLLSHSLSLRTNLSKTEFNSLAKTYIENMIYNPVVLIRRKILVVLEYVNQSYPKSNLLGYTVNNEVEFFQPRLDISQFWTTESNFTNPRRLYNKESIDIEIDFEIIPKKVYDQREVLKLFLAPELSLFFDNLTADQIKTWIASNMHWEIGFAACFVLIHALLKIFVTQTGTLISSQKVNTSGHMTAALVWTGGLCSSSSSLPSS